MLPLVALAVVVVGLGGVGIVAARLRLSPAPGRDPATAGFASWPAIGLVAAIALVLIVLGGLVVGTGVDSAPTQEPAAEPEARSPRPVTGPSDTTIRMSAAAAPVGAFPTSYAVLDELRPGSVVRIRVDGFDAHVAARVAQCTHGRVVACANRFPVQFDADGVAVFQYQVQDDLGADAVRTGGCRAGTGRCTLVVEALDGTSRAEVDTVFHDRAPEPGLIRVVPSSGLLDGAIVQVTVSGYPPGAEVVAALCAAPESSGPQCAPPGPTSTLRVGPDGSGSTTLTIHAGPVGTRGVTCGQGHVCGIAVSSPDTSTRAPVATISFAPTPGARYDDTRLAIGLGVAALLAGLAVWLIRATDWGPVGEAAAPEIDEAEYADLDAIVAALPPDEDELIST